MHTPLRLRCSHHALVANYRWLTTLCAVPVGAAIKADGYGLGAPTVMNTLAGVGCRDFFVSTWVEAAELASASSDLSIGVLHGLGPDDVTAAFATNARPVLNSAQQVARWKQVASGRPCDVMIDTGMNRLGLRPEEIDQLDGLVIDTLHSHLACADEDHALNDQQRNCFAEVAASVAARRYSLANSAGIMLGEAYHFDLVRPGLALYGGVPREEARSHVQQVARLEAQVVQRRVIRAGESCGYSATFVADRDVEAAVVNIGYADGYWRGFSSRGDAHVGEARLPVLGRVSMDLVILDASAASDLEEGSWVEMNLELASAATQSGMSQYELLTGLGQRYERSWD